MVIEAWLYFYHIYFNTQSKYLDNAFLLVFVGLCEKRAVMSSKGTLNCSLEMFKEDNDKIVRVHLKYEYLPASV